MLPKYGVKRLRLLFTDTDSLCYHIQTEDFYRDIAGDIEAKFDTADYPSDHPLYNTVNKKVIGMMKDETAGNPVREFVGLRSKMYSYVVEKGKKENKKAKGIKKCVTEKGIRHADYKDCLFNKVPREHSMIQIKSKNHQLQTVNITKTSFSPYDDKRHILNDGVNTLAHGHYSIIK